MRSVAGIGREMAQDDIGMNEPDGLTATLTLTKADYQTCSHQYRGNPDGRVEICLAPTGP